MIVYPTEKDTSGFSLEINTSSVTRVVLKDNQPARHRQVRLNDSTVGLAMAISLFHC